MEIEQGCYVKQHIENLNYDDYFLVLEVENKHIKATKHRGTPVDSTILDYEELTDVGYTIEVLSEKYVDCITKYGTYLKNGIPASYPTALQYRWGNKEYTIPLKQKYWNGSKWAVLPEGFYK